MPTGPAGPDRGPGVERPDRHELLVRLDAALVGTARRFAVQATAAVGGDDDAQDAVRMLVSELVTNVLLHARTDALVRVAGLDALVRVDVLDASAALPHLRRVDGTSTTGRGLLLVQALSVANGVVPDSTLGPDGKAVWFTVAKAGGSSADSAVAAAALEVFGADMQEVW